MTFKSLMAEIAGTINIIVVFLLVLAVATFIWGMARRMLSAGDPKKAREGYYYLILGVVAFAVISSIWVLMVFVAGLLGIKVSGVPQFLNKEPAEPTSGYFNPCDTMTPFDPGYEDCLNDQNDREPEF